jgi:integrase
MPRIVTPLTPKRLDNARWKAGEKNRLFDGGGMFLLLKPDGAKWWRLKYRRPTNGKENLLSLGTYPETTLRKARERREELRRLIEEGIDPAERRKQAKRELQGRIANTFEAVAREWYSKQAHVWVPHHASDVLRRLESNLFPEIGNKPIADITPPTLLAAVRKIEHRGAHDLAHRVLQVASQVFRYGVATGRCQRDPAPDLRGALTPHKSKHQAAVAPEELPALLRAIDSYGELGDKLTGHALRLLALTFVRTNELIGAEWSELDLDAAIWIIPAERMKMKAEHVVPLSRQALKLLREVRALGGGSRYVFPGRNPDKPMSNNTMLFALYRLGYKGKMTGHGFRAVASTMLNEAGFRGDVIERQLAHSERNAIRGAYNRAEYLPERRAMMQRWADMLSALMDGAQVIPLQRRG